MEVELALAVVEREAEHRVSTGVATRDVGRPVEEGERAALEERMHEVRPHGRAAYVKVEVARLAPVLALVDAVLPAAVALEQSAAGGNKLELVPWVGGVGYL